MNDVRFVLRASRGFCSIPAFVDTLPVAGAGTPAFWIDPRDRCLEPVPGVWIIGRVFPRIATGRSLAAIDWASLPSTMQDRAQWLVGNCWGAWCAILQDNTGLSVLTDPSGLLPVYRKSDAREHVLLSHAEDLSRATGRSNSVDFGALASFLAWPDLRQRRTCLEGLRQLPPGVLLSLDDRSPSEEVIWRAGDFLPREPFPSLDDAAAALRVTAMQVLGTWADCFGPVAVASSGGVDSSLVCAALKCAGQDFSCATVSTQDASGDERAHVRLLAGHLGVGWAEEFYDPAQIDPALCASAGLPVPRRRSFLAALDARLAAAAADLGAHCVFDGNGGDNLFGFLHSALPAVDLLRHRAPLSQVSAAMLDTARLTGCTLPQVAAAAIRGPVAGSGTGLWAPDTSLLASPPDPDATEPLFSWLDCNPGKHAGKAGHLALLLRAQVQLNGLTEGEGRFSPLISQPLIELCLSIPTWLWQRGGINRAVARGAFAKDLPVAIVERVSKAGPDNFVCRLFARHRAYYRELLLDGQLCNSGMLDRAALEQALERDPLAASEGTYRLFDLVEAEIWARSW